ncbi:class I SAM-dependent methyltransferase [Nocardioides acrostichi]|uniref:Class I SAM-dependent methyltransferase n=1 Tax=Nocardioides acrostichi TaxID=2784339 RepID=A0A930Y7R5_9ACTN|nr:class I SAM-dependent methyltransferase [Nocardioides acrostichi]MBF4162276.1 class I SAM-dependent methyltransferase [Nocardioides acrostichi]
MNGTFEPDVKDWTWVLERPCPDCGFDAARVGRAELGTEVLAGVDTWRAVLAVDDAGRRPDEATWSVLEYGCHVRDVHLTFAERVRLVLAEHDPLFANWDQDAAAVEERYGEQTASVVVEELASAARDVAAVYDELDPLDDDLWARPSRRSNGSTFTLESLARYHLHDEVHHRWDVRAAAQRATVCAYDRSARAYAAASFEVDDAVGDAVATFAEAVGTSGRVLEIGSGGGRDARLLAEHGLTVRCTDVSPGFVALLHEAGLEADVLDPLRDVLLETGQEPYDGVWANACLLHVARADLGTVLTRLAAATRTGGALFCSLKEGEGEAWSTHGHVAAPRRFTYWREPALREVLAAGGWRVLEVTRREGLRGERWLMVHALRGRG